MSQGLIGFTYFTFALIKKKIILMCFFERYLLVGIKHFSYNKVFFIFEIFHIKVSYLYKENKNETLIFKIKAGACILLCKCFIFYVIDNYNS